MRYLIVDASLHGTGIRDEYEGGYLTPASLGISSELANGPTGRPCAIVATGLLVVAECFADRCGRAEGAVTIGSSRALMLPPATEGNIAEGFL